MLGQSRETLAEVSSQRSTPGFVSAAGATSTSGICAPAGTFISERAERISVTRSTSQPISASALGIVEPVEIGPGGERQDACRAAAAASSPLIAQSSSVMNGMKGCSSLTDLVEHEGHGRLRLGFCRASSSP